MKAWGKSLAPTLHPRHPPRNRGSPGTGCGSRMPSAGWGKKDHELSGELACCDDQLMQEESNYETKRREGGRQRERERRERRERKW